MLDVEIYMKSGNVIRVIMRKISWTKSGNEYTELKWSGLSQKNNISTILPHQIEAIVVRRQLFWSTLYHTIMGNFKNES